MRLGMTFDRSRSKEYRRSLEEYCGAILEPGSNRFCCEKYEDCQSSVREGHYFAKGQLSYVGAGYAAALDGRSMRILVVSIQTGETEECVTIGKRGEQIRDRRDEPFTERNPHMKGVTLAQQTLLGLEPGEEEMVADGLRVLDAYAMANASLCSTGLVRKLRNGRQSRSGSPTGKMFENCASYLRKTIELLEPTIIHTQGARKQGASTKQAFVDHVADSCEWIDENQNVGRAEIGRVRAVACGLHHPSTLGKGSWSRPRSRYFLETAKPALLRARELALSR